MISLEENNATPDNKVVSPFSYAESRGGEVIGKMEKRVADTAGRIEALSKEKQDVFRERLLSLSSHFSTLARQVTSLSVLALAISATPSFAQEQIAEALPETPTAESFSEIKEGDTIQLITHAAKVVETKIQENQKEIATKAVTLVLKKTAPRLASAIEAVDRLSSPQISVDLENHAIDASSVLKLAKKSAAISFLKNIIELQKDIADPKVSKGEVMKKLALSLLDAKTFGLASVFASLIKEEKTSVPTVEKEAENTVLVSKTEM